MQKKFSFGYELTVPKCNLAKMIGGEIFELCAYSRRNNSRCSRIIGI